jgi:hypothetical protein
MGDLDNIIAEKIMDHKIEKNEGNLFVLVWS